VEVCAGLTALERGLGQAAAAVAPEEALASADLHGIAARIAAQPAWSDFPFVLLSRHGGGLERNPVAARLTAALGNVSFLERPFHPTTLVAAVRTALAARRRQYQVRDALIEREAAAERLRFALRAGRLGSWELDVETQELRASDACKAVFGRAADEPFGYADLLAAVHPDDLDRSRPRLPRRSPATAITPSNTAPSGPTAPSTGLRYGAGRHATRLGSAAWRASRSTPRSGAPPRKGCARASSGSGPSQTTCPRAWSTR
jgi:PAS domain-containing protein